MGLFDGLKNFASSPKLADIGAILQDSSGGTTNQDALAKRRADQLEQEQAAQQRQQIAALADQLNLSPKEKLLYMANPKAFGELLKEQQSPYSLAQGTRRYQGGGALEAENPDTFTFGDQVMSADSNGVRPLMTRDKTYSEKTQEQELAERIANNARQYQLGQGNLGVAQSRLGLERQRFNREGAGGGKAGLSTMSTEQLMALARNLK